MDANAPYSKKILGFVSVHLDTKPEESDVMYGMRNANFAFKCARSFYKMRARNLMNIKKHFEGAK